MRNCLWLLAMAYLTCGCGNDSRSPDASLPRPLPVSVLADSAPGTALPPARWGGFPRAHLTLLRVSPQREAEAPQAEAPPGEPPSPTGGAERLPIDDRLRPPVPRDGATLHLAQAGGRWVDLDVRIDESGVVTDAAPVAGDTAAALVLAACRAARAVRFYPARLSGRAVAVWTRQRFDLTR